MSAVACEQSVSEGGMMACDCQRILQSFLAYQVNAYAIVSVTSFADLSREEIASLIEGNDRLQK